MRGCLQKRKTKRGLKPGEFSWSIILSLGRDPVTRKPKQKWITFHGTRKQAEEKLNSLVGDVHRGEFVEPTKLTLGEWLDEWLDKAIKPPRCTVNAYVTYGGAIKNHLKPALGHLRLQTLTHLHLERHYADSKLAPASLAVQHTILTTALKAAVNAGMLKANVASRVMNKPRPDHHDDVLNNVWTADEARTFLVTAKERASTQHAALFALALDSGARKRELLALRWKDVNGTKLQIERQLASAGHAKSQDGEPVFVQPKGKRARSLDLSEDTLALLAEHKRHQAELKLRNRLHYRDHGLIFAQGWEHLTGRHTPIGSAISGNTFNRELDRLVAIANVKRITVHGLRHTCATLLLAAGVQPHVVQRRLGHASIEITLNLYAHVLPAMQADAAAKLATLLHG